MENTKNKNNPITTIVVAVVVALLSFFAGTKYQQSKLTSLRANFTGQRDGQFVRGGNIANGQAAGGFRPVNGTILSIDDKSLTVKLADGSSKIIILTDTTQINKATDANLQDLTVGESVNLFGPQNDDGTITAQTIQVGTMPHIVNPNQ